MPSCRSSAIEFPFRRARLSAWVSVLLGLSAILAPASGSMPIEIPAQSCRNGHFAVHQGHRFRLGEVQSPTHLYQDEEGCPSAAACQTQTYLRRGAQVILNQIAGDWACVWHQGQGEAVVGWVPFRQLVLKLPPQASQLQDWLGEWRLLNVAALRLGLAPDFAFLTLSGEAFWQGAVVNGEAVIHVGELRASQLRPQGQQLVYRAGDESWDCRAEMTLLPPYLIVDDNLQCGGMNVSFRGVYRR